MGGMWSASELLFYRLGCPLAAQATGANNGPDEVQSVIDEVTRLLNTRAPLSASECAALPRRTVVDYGLPDFLHFSPLSGQDAQLLADLIRDTITAYEPRLQIVSVTVDTPRPSRDRVCAVVCGQVRKRDRTMVPVRFPVFVAMAMTHME